MTDSQLQKRDHGVYQPQRMMGLSKETGAGVRDRIATIDGAVHALERGALDTTMRAAAQRAAHKIAATAASQGLWDQSELAREMEAAFDGYAAIDPAVIMRLTSIVTALKASFGSPA